MLRTAIILGVLLPTAGCFSPVYNEPQCGPGGECPDGFTCENGFCVSGGGIDASLDAEIPTGCYLEAADPTNDNGAEVTGITIDSTTGGEICGELNDRPPDVDGIIDVDRYQISNPEGRHVVVRVVSANASVYEQAILQLALGFQAPSASFSSGYGVLGQTVVTATSFDVLVGAINTAGQVGQAVPYRLYVETIDFTTACPGAILTAPEELDAATGNLGNDVYTIDFSSAAHNFTPDPNDAPEDFTTTIDDGPPMRFTGTVPNVDTHADSYRDRDSFLVHIGDNINELTVVLNWPYDGTQPDFADLDFILYPDDGTTVPTFTGFTVGANGPEAATVNVTPGGTYQILVANYMDAMAADKGYELLVCGAQFVP